MKLIKIVYTQYDDAGKVCYKKRALLGLDNENLKSYKKFKKFLVKNFEDLVNRVDETDFNGLINEHKSIKYRADYGLMGFSSINRLSIKEVDFSDQILMF